MVAHVLEVVTTIIEVDLVETIDMLRQVKIDMTQEIASKIEEAEAVIVEVVEDLIMIELEAVELRKIAVVVEEDV